MLKNVQKCSRCQQQRQTPHGGKNSKNRKWNITCADGAAQNNVLKLGEDVKQSQLLDDGKIKN